MAKQDDYVRYTIRVPADVYERIKEAAGEKSVNAEIVSRLEEFGKLVARQPRISFLESEIKRLEREVADLQSANESLTKVITDAATEFDGVEGSDRIDVLLTILQNEIRRRKNGGAVDLALAQENAALKADIERLEAEQPIFNIVLDAKGHPLDWPNIAAHIHRTAKAAGLDSVGFRAAIFDSTKLDDPFYDREYRRLVRWYQEQTRKNKDAIRGSEPYGGGDEANEVED